MKRLSIGIVCALFSGWAIEANASLDLMGYFDTEYTVANFDQDPVGRFDQHHLALLLQHETDRYKFFSEIEYEHAPVMEATRSSGAVTGAEKGGLLIERAWADIHLLAGKVVLRLGKTEAQTLWELNHYPNLRLPVTKPQMVGTIFKSNFTGMMLHGELGNFHYATWMNKGDPYPGTNEYPRGMSGGGHLGWKAPFVLGVDRGELALGFTLGQFSDPEPTQPQGVELEFEWRHFRVWSEFAWNAQRRGSYQILSYSLNSSDGEWVPFLMSDTYKEGTDIDSRRRYGVGLNFKPKPEIAFKVEWVHHPAANGERTNNGMSAAFAYFLD